MLPRFIKSQSEFQNSIHLGSTQESDNLDFKACVDFNGKKDRTSLAEDIAIDISAFANSLGGTLLIGVSEKVNENGIRIANGLCPVNNGDEIKILLNDDVRNLIEPDIRFETWSLNVPQVVISINVEPSINLVGVKTKRDRRSFCFPFRTELGNRYFSFSDVEAKMRWTDTRANYLKLLFYLQNMEYAEVTIYPIPLVNNMTNSSIKILKGNTKEFEVTINSRVIRLPFSLVEEIWNKSNVGQSLCLKLRERIIERSKAGPLDLDHPLDRESNEKMYQDAYYPPGFKVF